MRDPAQYLVLLAPAVTFLLTLSTRQARISMIARENAKQMLDAAKGSSDDPRIENLRAQNRLLLSRYRLIQLGLLVICVGLLTLGIHAFDEYFSGEPVLLRVGIVGMVAGTVGILYEIARAGDTLNHEIAFCEWIITRSASPPPPKMKRWSIFRG